MAVRQLILDLLARDKTGRDTKSAARNLKGVADAADDVTFSTKAMGDSVSGATRRVEGLDSQIKTVNQNLVFLHQQMADAQTAAERLDIAKGIRKAEAELRRLSKSRDVLKNLLPDPAPAARNFAVRLGSSLAGAGSGALSAAGSAVGPTVGIAIGAAAAVPLAATLSTALAAGAGAGVIGAGIALAIKGDDRLKNAGKLLGIQFIEGLAQTAKNTLGYQIPLIFGNLESAGQRITAKLGKAFTQLSPYIKPFIKDVTAAAEAVGGAFIDAAGRSGPALAGFGRSIRLLGDGVADFVTILADGGPEAASVLTMIAGATADVMRHTAMMLNLFSKAANNPWITGPIFQLLKKHYNDAAKGQEAIADSAPMAIDGIADLGEEAKKQTPVMQSAADALKEYANNSQSLWDATTRAAEAVDNVNKAYKENGKTLSENTTKGRANRDALSGLASAYNATYENSLKVNGEGPKTDAIATNNAKNFVILARRLGASKKEAIDLANKMLAIPDVQRRITITGTSAAVRAAKTVKSTLESIKNRTVRVNVITASGHNSSELRHAYEKNAREFGGPVRKNKAYVVGEKRAEVFVPDQDGTIVPSIDQYNRSMGDSGGRWAAPRSGGGAIKVVVSGGGGNADWLWQAVNYGFRNGLIAVVPG